MPTERYPTPDGKLTLLVDRAEDDTAIGFESFTWHAHADIVAQWHEEKDEEHAIRQYLDDIFNDRLPIVILKKNGLVADVWVSDSPEEPYSTHYMQPGETFEVRVWSGNR